MRKDIKALKSVTLNVNDLHFQMCPWVYCDEVWNGDKTGLVENSPHVDFLRLYKKMGKQVLLKLNKTRYSKMYEHWDNMGYGLGGRTPAYIKKKACSLINLFNSIRKKGFDRKSQIQVLETPLWLSRGFDGGDSLVGPEVFHGHHRSACLFVLNKKRVHVTMVLDRLCETKKWTQKLTNVRR